MGAGTGHSAQGIGQSGGDRKNGEHLNQVRERSWVLEWMCTVGIEESATIGAPLLDNFLGGHRTLRDGLGGNGVHHRFPVRLPRGFAVRPEVRYPLRFY